jgi:hypothetical protein
MVWRRPILKARYLKKKQNSDLANAFRVAWSPRAVEDLEAIAEFISADFTAYAAAVVKTILSTARTHSCSPL